MVGTRKKNLPREPLVSEAQAQLYEMTRHILAALDVARNVSAEERHVFNKELSDFVVCA